MRQLSLTKAHPLNREQTVRLYKLLCIQNTRYKVQRSIVDE
jgi:hypothetical protein